MDSFIKNEQLTTSITTTTDNFIETDREFINSLLPLDDDVSYSIDSYTNGILLPVLSPTSTSSSSTSSFFYHTEPSDFSSIPLQPSLSPAPSATSTNSSLSLSIDINSTNLFLFNSNSRPLHSDSYENFGVFTNPCNDQLMSQTNDMPYYTWGSVKQDVSVGTDFSVSRDMRYKKDFDWMDGLKLNGMPCVQRQSNLSHSSVMVKNDKESFKLVEKIQPKKSRTKYTKEQIDLLESAYWRNAYPDVITIEHLCKSLGISKEKINVRFCKLFFC